MVPADGTAASAASAAPRAAAAGNASAAARLLEAARAESLQLMRDAAFTLCADAGSACPYDALASGSIPLLLPGAQLPPLVPLGEAAG